eukprot:Skav219614  [mRNA]  locus=scaffold628:123788:126015:- [translate_table: standard]
MVSGRIAAKVIQAATSAFLAREDANHLVSSSQGFKHVSTIRLLSHEDLPKLSLACHGTAVHATTTLTAKGRLQMSLREAQLLLLALDAYKTQKEAIALQTMAEKLAAPRKVGRADDT